MTDRYLLLATDALQAGRVLPVDVVPPETMRIRLDPSRTLKRA